ncbi:hypothetical protein LRS06_09020 [Hymenobacter sp. J193]|uniref:hypothetical protein n=1 Tax=Hymenobacter sp. J193 TaxID=2898429 RepID=UPI0021512DB4|nr:hypothetical protein [Hymenobacter sp. J193]MCR5887917.1 hypothetical protein [Hymenobacter sp. J193]
MKNFSAFLLIGAFVVSLPLEASCETVGTPETAIPLAQLRTELRPGKLFTSWSKRKKQNKRRRASQRRSRWAVNG